MGLQRRSFGPGHGERLSALVALGVFLLALFAEPLHHVTVRHHAGADGDLLHCESDCHAPAGDEHELPDRPRWSSADHDSVHTSCGLRFEARADGAPRFDSARIARPIRSGPALEPRVAPGGTGPDLFLIAPKNSPPRHAV